VRCWKN